MSWVKFLLVKINISKIDLDLSKPMKNAESNSIHQMYLFKILKKAKVCLPKLEIEKFDEDVINWSSFRDHFLSEIHKNDSLSGINECT